MSISDTNKEYNPWIDKQRTDNLSKVVSVQKDKKGQLISSEKLEKICVRNGVSVHKTFHMKKYDTTVMIPNSQNDVAVLTAKLRNHSVLEVNRLVGFLLLCSKVYDSIFVPRSFNCQGYGAKNVRMIKLLGPANIVLLFGQ